MPLCYCRSGTHNLIGIVQANPSYLKRYGEAFPEPTRVRAYDFEIYDNAMAVVRACLKAADKARRADRATYDTARRETTQFVLAVVAYIWVRELRDPETIYTEVDPRDRLDHLQAGCTDRHTLDRLVLHNEMQSYHLEVEGIPEYINMLEDAQRQAGRAGRAISDDTLLIFSSMVMLTSEWFPQTNNAWEDRAKPDKTWVTWKLAYKQAHAKARVKAQAHGGNTKFGAANSAACPEDQLPLDTQHEGASANINTLEGYFTNLAAAATNEKVLLNQLVLNNTTLTNSNESLVALVNKQANDLKNLERELARLEKPQVSARNPPTLCANCKKEGYHQPQDCYELAKNKDKRPPGWRSAL